MSLKEALEAAGIRIIKFDPSKARPVTTSTGTMDIRKFSKILLEKLGANMFKFPEVFQATHDLTEMEKMLEAHAQATNTIVQDNQEIIIPDDFKDLTLNLNLSEPVKERSFFLTTARDVVSRKSGMVYINLCQMPLPEAYKRARRVIPEYRPRGPVGVVEEINLQTKELEPIFNTYTPPEWHRWREENGKAFRELSKKPPDLFVKLVKHLIPNADDRRYLYAWMYASLRFRSYVYLVLCGAPGAGKNRLKLVLRALHGRDNTIDGKKSTLVDKFNYQLARGTLCWYDELHYNSEMENVMKEIQNDYISIERKGVDATSTSTIHTSMVISNNKPRDNYIAFDARKFAPLTLAHQDLKHSMTSDEIEELSNKLEPGSPGFDPSFVAQIYKFIMKVGRYHYEKDTTLEHKSAMFWILAHTSMTKWQKHAVTALMDRKTGTRIGWDENEHAHLWSKVEEKINRRAEKAGAITFPDFSSVRAFFDIFRDGEGRKAFDTKLVTGPNILGDFWIFPLLKDIEIITEATVAQQREKGRQNAEKEEYDL